MIHLCHKCDKRQARCAGECRCAIDGVDIIQHAKSGQCPKGYFDGVSMPAIPDTLSGPGDVIKLVFAKMGYISGGDCGCETMRKQMNDWGYWGCWKHRSELVEWFNAKAKEAGVQVTPAGIMRIIVQAWNGTHVVVTQGERH